jgi:protein ImuB
VFWLDADGFSRLHPALDTWARAIVADLREAGFAATIVVGFTRFGTYAVAKSGHGLKVFASAADEDAAMRSVKLRRLDLDADVRDRLERLGIRTVADFLRLPPGGLRQRFGDGVYRFHRLAAGDLWNPLQGLPYVEPLTREAELEAPDSDAGRLLFLVKRLLDSLLATLAARHEGLASMTLDLRLDDHREYSERLRPAAPTLDAVQLIGLVRLRLETLRLTSGVCALRLTAEGVPIADEQVRLFNTAQRDPQAAFRAFARLRAEFGEDVVVRAVLREGHLPVAQFAWEPITALAERLPAPRDVGPRPLVRRIYQKPAPLPARPRHEPEEWQIRGRQDGHVQRLWGPYVVSGGWWRRLVQRDYYFAETNRGERLWIYYDRLRRRFYLEGTVE